MLTLPDRYRPSFDKFKHEAWAAAMDWGTLLVFGVLAALTDGLREYLHKKGVAEVWVRTAFIVEAITITTGVGPKLIEAARNLLEALLVAVHDVVYAAWHGSRRPRQGTGRSDSGER